MSEIGQFTGHDNLIAGSAVETVTGTNATLAATTVALKRGQALELSGANYIVLATAANFSAILAKDVEASTTTQPIAVYHTGEFNIEAIITDKEVAPTIPTSALVAPGRHMNIHFKTTFNNSYIA